MMGPRQEAQAALFYNFSIEDIVPQDHVLRGIDQFLDLAGIRQHLAPYYSSTGRPSIDPELMMRMLVVGYVMGIRSERRLCEEVHLNLAYRWFCKLDLTDAVPDHSTFSKNGHGRFRDSDLLRHVFETVVAQCIEAGLASGQRLAADASIIAADANRHLAPNQWIYERYEKKEIAEKYILFPDMSANPGSFDKCGNRSSFYGTDNRINLELSGIIQEFFDRCVVTVVEIKKQLDAKRVW